MRARAPYPAAMRQAQKDGDVSQRPAIVKKGELESLDRLGGTEDCWASGIADVDYSQRLVFSDEEDFADKRFARLVVSANTAATAIRLFSVVFSMVIIG